MDWEYVEKILPLYGKAAVLTVRIGVLGIFFAILVGLLCSVVRQMKIPVLKQLASVYIELSRNTPLLVQLFFIYYGLPKIGIRTDPETCGVAGLAFLGGSYMAEAFRSGLEAVGRIQHESALSLGLTGLQTFRYVILPQAFAISFPGITWIPGRDGSTAARAAAFQHTRFSWVDPSEYRQTAFGRSSVKIGFPVG